MLNFTLQPPLMTSFISGISQVFCTRPMAQSSGQWHNLVLQAGVDARAGEETSFSLLLTRREPRKTRERRGSGPASVRTPGPRVSLLRADGGGAYSAGPARPRLRRSRWYTGRNRLLQPQSPPALSARPALCWTACSPRGGRCTPEALQPAARAADGRDWARGEGVDTAAASASGRLGGARSRIVVSAAWRSRSRSRSWSQSRSRRRGAAASEPRARAGGGPGR